MRQGEKEGWKEKGEGGKGRRVSEAGGEGWREAERRKVVGEKSGRRHGRKGGERHEEKGGGGIWGEKGGGGRV